MAAGYRVAVVGATGNVGRETLNILAGRRDSRPPKASEEPRANKADSNDKTDG